MKLIGLSSLFAQIFGIATSVYLFFNSGIKRAILLIFIVWIGHHAAILLSDSLIFIHRKLFINKDQLDELSNNIFFSKNPLDCAPLAWKIISSTCGILYIYFVVTFSWFVAHT